MPVLDSIGTPCLGRGCTDELSGAEEVPFCGETSFEISALFYTFQRRRQVCWAVHLCFLINATHFWTIIFQVLVLINTARFRLMTWYTSYNTLRNWDKVITFEQKIWTHSRKLAHVLVWNNVKHHPTTSHRWSQVFIAVPSWLHD